MAEITRAPEASQADPAGVGTGTAAGAESAGAQPKVGDEGGWRGRVAAARLGAQTLYPVSAGRGVSPLTVLGGVLFVAVATALSLHRVAGPGALQSMWAEDGAVFYQATFHQGFFAALFTPNNGYAEFLPRFLIGLIAFLPVAHAATAIALTGAILSSALALLVYHASAEHIRARVPRGCLALVTALLVYGAGEVANNIVNLQWYLLYVTFWMFLWNPQAVGRRALAAVVLFVAVASDPVSTFFLSPLLAVRLWSRPWKESRWQVYGMAAGLVFQLAAILHGGGGPRKLTPEYSLTYTARSYAHDILGNALVSRTELTEVGFTSQHLADAIGVALLVVAIIGAVLLRSRRGLFVGVTLFSSVALFTLSVVASGYSLPRYDTAPILLLITAFAALVDAPRFSRRFLTAFCVLLAVNVFANYPIGADQYRSQSPSWIAQVKDGKHACKENPAIGSVTVQTAPGGGWVVDVPCSSLL